MWNMAFCAFTSDSNHFCNNSTANHRANTNRKHGNHWKHMNLCLYVCCCPLFQFCGFSMWNSHFSPQESVESRRRRNYRMLRSNCILRKENIESHAYRIFQISQSNCVRLENILNYNNLRAMIRATMNIRYSRNWNGQMMQLIMLLCDCEQLQCNGTEICRFFFSCDCECDWIICSLISSANWWKDIGLIVSEKRMHFHSSCNLQWK